MDCLDAPSEDCDGAPFRFRQTERCARSLKLRRLFDAQLDRHSHRTGVQPRFRPARTRRAGLPGGAAGQWFTFRQLGIPLFHGMAPYPCAITLPASLSARHHDFFAVFARAVREFDGPRTPALGLAAGRRDHAGSGTPVSGRRSIPLRNSIVAQRSPARSGGSADFSPRPTVSASFLRAPSTRRRRGMPGPRSRRTDHSR